MVSLLAAVGEMSVRHFFFNLYLKDGLKSGKVWTLKQKRAYAKREMLRVQDSFNDMLVEYLSSVIAGTFIVFLDPTGKFNFATEKVVSTDALPANIRVVH